MASDEEDQSFLSGTDSVVVDKNVEINPESIQGEEEREEEAPEESNDQDFNNDNNLEDDNNNDDDDDDVFKVKIHKQSEVENATQKKKVRRAPKGPEVTSSEATGVDAGFVGAEEEPSYEDEGGNAPYEDPQARRRRLLEEKMDAAVKNRTSRRRKADEDDLERMQDDRIDELKDRMIKAANLDVDKNSQGQIATEKLKLLPEVTSVLSKVDMAISILDNNLLEAVRLWLEPLPDASMPAYQIQKELILSLETLPIKTDHLIASGIGKVLVFYQRSNRIEPNLKRIVDRLIGDWTRPILNKSDSYKDRTIQFNEYNKKRFSNQLLSQRAIKPQEEKSLYEQSAERRRRAAIPAPRTTAYKIAPRVDASLLRNQQMRSGAGSAMRDERFKSLNLKLTSMGVKKKTTKKGGPSIEGRNLAM